jgi:hypothetical protein
MQRFAYNKTFEQAFVSGSPGSTARPMSGSVPTAAPISLITAQYAIRDHQIRIARSRILPMPRSCKSPAPA